MFKRSSVLRDIICNDTFYILKLVFYGVKTTKISDRIAKTVIAWSFSFFPSDTSITCVYFKDTSTMTARVVIPFIDYESLKTELYQFSKKVNCNDIKLSRLERLPYETSDLCSYCNLNE